LDGFQLTFGAVRRALEFPGFDGEKGRPTGFQALPIKSDIGPLRTRKKE